MNSARTALVSALASALASAACAQESRIRGSLEPGPCLRAAWIELDNTERYEVPAEIAADWIGRRVSAAAAPLNRSLCGNALALHLSQVQLAPPLLELQMAIAAGEADRAVTAAIELLRRWPEARLELAILSGDANDVLRVGAALAAESARRRGALLVRLADPATRAGLRARVGASTWEVVHGTEDIGRIAARAGLR